MRLLHRRTAAAAALASLLILAASLDTVQAKPRHQKRDSEDEAPVTVDEPADAAAMQQATVALPAGANPDPLGAGIAGPVKPAGGAAAPVGGVGDFNADPLGAGVAGPAKPAAASAGLPGAGSPAPAPGGAAAGAAAAPVPQPIPVAGAPGGAPGSRRVAAPAPPPTPTRRPGRWWNVGVQQRVQWWFLPPAPPPPPPAGSAQPTPLKPPSTRGPPKPRSAKPGSTKPGPAAAPPVAAPGLAASAPGVGGPLPAGAPGVAPVAAAAVAPVAAAAVAPAAASAAATTAPSADPAFPAMFGGPLAGAEGGGLSTASADATSRPALAQNPATQFAVAAGAFKPALNAPEEGAALVATNAAGVRTDVPGGGASARGVSQAVPAPTPAAALTGAKVPVAPFRPALNPPTAPGQLGAGGAVGGAAKPAAVGAAAAAKPGAAVAPPGLAASATSPSIILPPAPPPPPLPGAPAPYGLRDMPLPMNDPFNWPYNPRSAGVGAQTSNQQSNAPPTYSLTSGGSQVADHAVPVASGSTLLSNPGGGQEGMVSNLVAADRRTTMVGSDNQIYFSCSSQALRLLLGPCRRSLPAIRSLPEEIKENIAKAECRAVMAAGKVAAKDITPECCPDLRLFSISGCACDATTLLGGQLLGQRANELIIAARAAQVSYCANDTYGGPFNDPCVNIKNCGAYGAFALSAPPPPSPAAGPMTLGGLVASPPAGASVRPVAVGAPGLAKPAAVGAPLNADPLGGGAAAAAAGPAKPAAAGAPFDPDPLGSAAAAAAKPGPAKPGPPKSPGAAAATGAVDPADPLGAGVGGKRRKKK